MYDTFACEDKKYLSAHKMNSVVKIPSVESQTEVKTRCRNQIDINYKDISSEDEESWLDLDDEVAIDKSTRKVVDKPKKNRNVIVQNKAVNSNLNLLTLYKNRKKYCDRELFKIDKDSGSKTKEKQKFVYVALRTGLFEALKKNMVKIMEQEYGVTLVNDPKMETFGQSKAEERALLDLKFFHDAKEYEVKVHVYNTQCSIGIDSKTMKKETENVSIAEFFVKSILSKTVDILTSKLNIDELNEYCRELSNLGIKASIKGLNTCNKCSRKDVTSGKHLKILLFKGSNQIS